MLEGEIITQQIRDELYKLIVQANEIQSQELKKDILKTIKSVSCKIEKSEEEISQLKNRCTKLERKARKNNIIIFGLNVKNETLLQDTLTKLNELLGTCLMENDINNIYTVGRSPKKNIIIEFVTYLKKASIFKNVSKLKGTGIIIANDLSSEDREEQRILREHLKKAWQEQLRAKIKGNRLIIENKIFTVKDLITRDENKEMPSDYEEESVDEDSEDTETARTSDDRSSSKEINGKKEKLSIENRNKKNKDIKRIEQTVENIVTKKKKVRFSPKSFSATTGGNRKTRTQTSKTRYILKLHFNCKFHDY